MSQVCHFAEEKVQVKNDAPVEALRSRIAGEGSAGSDAAVAASRCVFAAVQDASCNAIVYSITFTNYDLRYATFVLVAEWLRAAGL